MLQTDAGIIKTGKKARSVNKKIACQGPARANKITYAERGITRRQVRYHFPEPNVFIQVKVVKPVNLA